MGATFVGMIAGLHLAIGLKAFEAAGMVLLICGGIICSLHYLIDRQARARHDT